MDGKQVLAVPVAGRGIPQRIPEWVAVHVPYEFAVGVRVHMYGAVQRVQRWKEDAWVIRARRKEIKQLAYALVQADVLMERLEKAMGQAHEGAYEIYKDLEFLAEHVLSSLEDAWDRAKELGIVKGDFTVED